MSPAAESAPSQDPPMLTPDEVAVLLRTTRKAIYAMVARGQLAGVIRRGRRRLLFQRDVLLRALTEGRAPSSPR